MYREHLMDHYKNPRKQGVLDAPTVEHHEKNPSCGDECTIQLKIDSNKITDMAFDGHGCAISMAATSMLMEELENPTIDEVLQLSKEDMLELIGIPLTTMRVKCGLLGLHTIKKAIYDHLGKEGKGEW